MSGGYDRGLYALLGQEPRDRRSGNLIASALGYGTAGRDELVAAGVSTSTPAAPLEPAARDLLIAAKDYLHRRPDTETARRRLRAAVDAMPMPPLGSLPGALLPFRIAAEMALRAYRSDAGMRQAEAVLERTRSDFCAAVRRSIAALEPPASAPDSCPLCIDERDCEVVP